MICFEAINRDIFDDWIWRHLLQIGWEILINWLRFNI
jgi:hypothetical protein